jgi:LMBR1 domain-containing protein 1
MGTILLMLSVLALMYSLTTIVAPQYAHFGSQTYCNHTIGDWGEVRDCTSVPQAIFPCSSASEAKEICTQTVVSLFLNRITLTFPFFGGVAFWGQFVFLGVWVLMGIWGCWRRPRLEDETVSDEEDDERTGLLERS